MKNSIVKKIMMTALTGTLILSSAVTAYAAPTGGRRGGKMEQGQNETTDSERPELPEDMQNGERPEPPEDMQNGERPEPPEDMQNGERPEPPEDGERPDGQMELPEGAVNIMAYKDALNGVDDEVTKTSLQAYIDELEEALDAERSALDSETELSDDEMASYRDAVTEAEEALKTAFEDAGIEVSDERPEPDDELPAGAAGNPAQDETADSDQTTTHTVRRNTGTNSEAGSGSVAASSDNSSSGGTHKSDESGWQKFKNWFMDLFS